jgi:hypothetical protein
MAEVYGITSTRDGIIRYVGLTGGDSSKRYWDHWVGLNSNHRVAVWKRQELWCGYDIAYVVIEECEADVAGLRETFWINRIPNLLNDRKGPGSRSHEMTVGQYDHIDSIQKSGQPDFEENWKGLIGIRCRHHIFIDGFGSEDPYDSWEARVYCPFGRRWSHGYSSIKIESALNERDRARKDADEHHIQRLGMAIPWPADISLKKIRARRG